jgi:hypothetical protein
MVAHLAERPTQPYRIVPHRQAHPTQPYRMVAHLAERPTQHRVADLTAEVAADPMVVASTAKPQPLNQAVHDTSSDGAFTAAAPATLRWMVCHPDCAVRRCVMSVQTRPRFS